MVRRRRPVETLQEAITATPQAAPAGGQAVTAAPIDIPIYDFAPISESIQGALQAKARRDAEKKIQAGERWAVENPALVEDIERDLAEVKDAKERSAKAKDAFAFLQRNGHIVPAGDPYWQVGYARAAGRQLAAGYRQRLQARLQEVSAVRDGGGEVTAAPDLERIIGEEWDKVGNSPAVQNFYGGQEALAVKAQADEEFRAKAAQQRAAVQERDYQDMLKREIGGRFDQLVGGNAVVTSETLRPITDYLTEEVRGHNVLNPRELTMEALELSIQKAAAIDPDEAVRMVYAAQDLVVGDVRLGDDRGEVGLRLQALTQQVRERASNALAEEVRTTDLRRKAAIQEAEAEYVDALVRAKADGQSVVEVGRALQEKFLREDAETGRFKGMGAFVVDALDDYVRAQDAARASDQQVLDQFNVLLADGDVDGAEALVRAAMHTGGITGEDYSRSVTTLAQRRDVAPFVENNGLYQTVKGRYGAAKPTGFTDEIQQRIDADVLERQRRLERDYVAFVRTTAGKQNREELHREWLATREGEDLEAIRASGAEVRAKGQEAIRAIRQRLVRHQSAEAEIAQAEREGTITVLEAQGMREESDKAVAARDRFFKTEAYQDAMRELDAQFQIEGGGAPTRELVTAQRLAVQAFQDQYEVALDAILSDPAASPATFDARARAAVRQTMNEIGDQLFPSNRKAQQKVLEQGGSAAEVVEATEALDQDLLLSAQWGALLADPKARENLSGKTLPGPRDPAVPEEVYDTAAKWMSGLDPFFGSPVTREDAEHVATRALSKIMRDPSLGEPQRQAAVGAVLALTGNVFPQDVLRGSVSVGPSDIEVDAARRRIQTLETWIPNAPEFQARRYREEIASLRPIAANERQDVPMEGYQWPPYTTPFFRSVAMLEAYQDRPEYPEFLSKLGIDPEDDAAVREWAKAQVRAIHRINP